MASHLFQPLSPKCRFIGDIRCLQIPGYPYDQPPVPSFAPMSQHLPHSTPTRSPNIGVPPPHFPHPQAHTPQLLSPILHPATAPPPPRPPPASAAAPCLLPRCWRPESGGAGGPGAAEGGPRAGAGPGAAGRGPGRGRGLGRARLCRGCGGDAAAAQARMEGCGSRSAGEGGGGR